MIDRQIILTGNLWRLMVKMSVPGILSMIVVSLNSLVDAVFISHLVNADAFAGVSLTIPLLAINSAVIGMLSAGSAAIYSKAIGSEDNHVKQNLFAHLVLLILLFAIPLGIIGLLFGNGLLSLLGASGRQLAFGTVFYKITMAGSMASIFGLCTSGLIRAEGNTRYAMKVTTFAVILNIVINPLLIKYGRMGVAGSALASVISMIVYSLLTFSYFFKGKGYLVISRQFKFSSGLLLNILTVGFPSFIMQVNSFFRQFVLFKLATYSSNNTTQLTSFTAIYRLFAFSAIPVFGMLQALGPIAGINFGAGKIERMAKAITIFRIAAVALMLFMALPGIIFPHTVLSLLLPENLINNQLCFYFRLVLWVLLMMPFASTTIVFMQSTGNSKIASRLTFSREFFIFLPVIFSAVYLFGYGGIYYGLLVENIIYISIVYFAGRKVLKKELSLQPAI